MLNTKIFFRANRANGPTGMFFFFFLRANKAWINLLTGPTGTLNHGPRRFLQGDHRDLKNPLVTFITNISSTLLARVHKQYVASAECTKGKLYLGSSGPQSEAPLSQ